MGERFLRLDRKYYLTAIEKVDERPSLWPGAQRGEDCICEPWTRTKDIFAAWESLIPALEADTTESWPAFGKRN